MTWVLKDAEREKGIKGRGMELEKNTEAERLFSMLLVHVGKCVLLEFNIQIKKYCLFHWGRVDCG